LSIADIDPKGLQDALESLAGKGHFATVVDVSKSAKVTAWIRDTAERLGGLDGAANVAGVVREGGRELADSRDEDWDFIMGINAAGVFYSMREELQQMIKGGGGSIVSTLVCLPFLLYLIRYLTVHILLPTGQCIQRCRIYRNSRIGNL
jgi:NAD(P)-dependent dehydrogenase (short-subunit alcohol dehydrogenase family)